jgi:hypothetical protein
MKLWFRWAFYYDDKTFKYGTWNYDGPGFHDKWQYQRLNQMIRAELHVKDLTNGITTSVHSCGSSDFREFRWFGKVAYNPFVGPHTVTLEPEMIGLQMVQRNGHKVTAFNYGKIERKGS